MEGWYVRHHDRQVHGPFSTKAIVDAVRSGNITVESELRHDRQTKGEWLPAGRFAKLQELFAKPAAVPPPPPQSTPAVGKRKRRAKPKEPELPIPDRTKHIQNLIFEGNYVFIGADGDYEIAANGVKQAKLAIKELRSFKKEISLEIRKVNANMKQIRGEYTAMVRHRGSVMRGGGKLGKFVRGVQSFSRDAQRSKLASDLAPHEDQKRRLGAFKDLADSVILQIESAILQHE